MFLTPTALTSQLWETYTVYLEAAVMTGVVVFAFGYLRRRKERNRALTNYLALFIAANAVMMVGFLLWLITSETALLALSLAVETVIYFDAVLTGAGLGRAFGTERATTGESGPRPSPSLPVAGPKSV